MKFTGAMRVYFNRHGSGLPWCVAADGWEIAVQAVTFDEVKVQTKYVPKRTPDDEDGKPSAWMEVVGSMTVSRGWAHITRAV